MLKTPLRPLPLSFPQPLFSMVECWPVCLGLLSEMAVKDSLNVICKKSDLHDQTP